MRRFVIKLLTVLALVFVIHAPQAQAMMNCPDYQLCTIGSCWDDGYNCISYFEFNCGVCADYCGSCEVDYQCDPLVYCGGGLFASVCYCAT